MYDLTFNPEKYEIKTCEVGDRSITYRAFEHIVYCANPASKIQTLNIYVLEEYYNGKTINGYSLNTAPIFAPNTVGGYMEGPAMEVGIDQFNHKPNSAFEALLHGYVVMCAGIRGRNTGMHSKEFFVGGTGHPYFSTDTGIVLRAIEMDAEGIFLAKAIDGVYDSDPKVNPAAKKYDEVSIQEVIDKKLAVVDLTASIMCMENKMPMYVFGLNEPDSIVNAMSGKFNGTKVTV